MSALRQLGLVVHPTRPLDRVLDAVTGWGAEHGATTAFLHVTDSNSDAAGLYERVGFTTHHTNRYLAAP